MKKFFIICLLILIVTPLIGCSNKTLDSNSDYTVENSNQSGTEEPQISDENSQNPMEENSNQVENAQEFTVSDKEVISHFDALKTNIDNVMNSEEVSSIKDSLKGAFITMVDFIFYDGEIKGIKFEDLTEGAKQNILETVSQIDNIIMKKFPNYKEEINDTTSNAFNKASELIKKGTNNIKDFSREKLGEENYNSIIEVKDELMGYTKHAFSIVGDFTGTIWDKGKDKIKNWYETFKNN